MSEPAIFQVNKYLSLRFQNNTTTIFVGPKPFRSCNYLLLAVDPHTPEKYDSISDINEAIIFLNKAHESNKTIISPETEFWGHYSNLQAWAESEYDTRLLDCKLSFPLLHELTKVGDSLAKQVFKEEIGRRWKTGSSTVRKYLQDSSMLTLLSKEELSAIGIEMISLQDKKHMIYDGDGTLNLSRIKIKDLPELENQIELSKIKHLTLQKCSLFSLPDSISNATSLETLDLSQNSLTSLPASIGELPNLKELNLSFNSLSSIPLSLGNLFKLKELSLSYNKLTIIPKIFQNLDSLEVLKLQGLHLRKFPSISNLTKLTHLNLIGNQISKIPQTIGNLKALQNIRLANNHLRELPSSLYNLNPSELYLNHNRLVSLSERFFETPTTTTSFLTFAWN
ncbi:MAG: hypothetical protein BAJALOKI1v1_2240005 [Promethearchaeota archaeon]|nr:MAG: hypothetical protein BAJALOKI1v1_2240005 [Candidatus Lokiarchaeota archaeon]